MKEWYDKSATSGHKWVVAVDEPWWGKRPKDLVTVLRKEVIWGAIMAGGHMEFYAGSDDVKHIEYASYEDCWTPMGHAAKFMNENLAKEIVNMKPNDDLAIGEHNWALANEGQTYLLYLKSGGEAIVDLSGAAGSERFQFNGLTRVLAKIWLTGTPEHGQRRYSTGFARRSSQHRSTGLGGSS